MARADAAGTIADYSISTSDAKRWSLNHLWQWNACAPKRFFISSATDHVPENQDIDIRLQETSHGIVG